MCFPFYPQDSEVNKEGEWKVVFALTYKMIIGQKLTVNMLYAEDGRQGAVRTRQGRVMSDSSYYHQPSSTDKVKFFVFVCLENVYVHGISV